LQSDVTQIRLQYPIDTRQDLTEADDMGGVLMSQSWTAERWLVLLLRSVGGICLLALIALWMPGSWINGGHAWLGLGEFPDAPIAAYLARSVSALSAFYGGLLVAVSFDVRRYAPIIRYQAVAIMALSVSGVVVGRWARMPLWFVGGDAVACWAYCLPMLVLADRLQRRASKPAPSETARSS
jgi:hypothetical protein